MTLSLPHLTQTVELRRGMAQLVHRALLEVLLELAGRNPQAGHRLSIPELLSLKPMHKLVNRLPRLIQRDQVPLKRPAPSKGRQPRAAKPPRPHRLKLACDELATVRLFYARLLATEPDPDHQLVLATALAQLHQPSLNLETHLRLPPATGPGAQTSFS